MCNSALFIFVLLGFLSIAASCKITFPKIENDFPTKCTLTDGAPGVCRNLKGCIPAQQSNATLQTCYFERFEHIVCCPEEKIKPEPLRMSPSAKVCHDLYNFYPIINGKLTKYNDFPYMAALGWETVDPGQYEYKCGGALVAYNFVLTAAHCAYVNGVPPSVVLIGGVNLTDTAVNVIKITEVKIHPDYNDLSVYNDIALLKLEKVAQKKPACIWDSFDIFEDNVTAVGYGHTRFGGLGSDQLLKADLMIVPNPECQQFFTPAEFLADGIINTQICAKDAEKLRDTCQGDSGGPLVYEINPLRPYIVGITSFGQGCARQPPGVYTRVFSYTKWIEDTIWPNDPSPNPFAILRQSQQF